MTNAEALRRLHALPEVKDPRYIAELRDRWDPTVLRQLLAAEMRRRRAAA